MPDLAVMLADGGDCLANVRAVRDQQALSGPVASDATAFGVIAALAGDPGLLRALRVARARARANAWSAGAAPDRIVIALALMLGAKRCTKASAVAGDLPSATREAPFVRAGRGTARATRR